MASDKKILGEKEEEISRLTRALKGARSATKKVAQQATVMVGDLMEDALTVAATGLAAWADGRMESYTIFGVDASIAIGLPLWLGGVGLTLFGMEELGGWVGAAGLGMVSWYLGKKAYIAGWKGREGNADKTPTLDGTPDRQSLRLGVVDLADTGVNFTRSTPAFRAA